MSMRYSRVPTREGPPSGGVSAEDEERKRRRSRLAEKISNKLHAAAWAVAAGLVVYHTDFLKVLLEDERVDRLWFNVSVVLLGINTVIMIYLTLYLPWAEGPRVSWNVHSPRAIPTATAVGVACSVTLNVALWGVWGFLTPLILFVVFVGCLFSLHFVPWPF